MYLVPQSNSFSDTVEQQHQQKIRLLQLKREQLHRTYPKLWLAKYHHLNTHQQRMSFGRRFRFFVDIYKAFDRYRKFCSMKSVQCGVSEAFVVAALDEAGKGLRVLYVLPNTDRRGVFVKDRVDILLKIVPYYAERLKKSVGESESIGLKHYGDGAINFVGSRSPADFAMFQADAIFIDELDFCDQKNLEMAPDRLDGSEYKYDRRIGNPTVENWGISATYNDSTRGRWFIQCSHCKKRQFLDFFKNVVHHVGDLDYELILGDRKNPQIVCCKCHKPIDRLSIGEWVHEYPDAERIGFQISQLFSANVTIKSMVDTFYKSIGNDTKMQIFYNSKLGLPYSATGNKVTFELLEAAISKKKRYSVILNNVKTALLCESKRLYVGIDVGKYFHVVARELMPSGHRRLVYAGRLQNTKEVVQVMIQIKPKVIMIDEGPELHLVEELKKELKKLFSCRFSRGQTLLDLRRKAEEYKRERRVRIDRTFILDCVKSDFSKHLIINPTNAKDLGNEDMEEYGEYYQHMLSSTRIFDEKGQAFVWIESGPDHFFLAESYCKMAELIDDRILEYYVKVTEDLQDKNLYEIAAEERKKGTLIPTTEDGKVDMDRLRVMNAMEFLQRLTDHTEDFFDDK